MDSLTNKKILIGVSGGIAAYKIPLLVRLLVRKGAEVRVLITPTAHRFVTAETLATVSKYPVYTDFFKDAHGEWNNHVEYGLWADLMLIAPAGANTLAKMAHGICDNLLLTTYLSARCPVYFAPAMDLDMYQHPATQANIELLKQRQCICIEPGTGELASGLVGEGRMAEPEEIVAFLENTSPGAQKSFSGKKVMITAGPTHENIDPVRFIGNHSTGKMGYAIAEAFSRAGAEVTLISGPVSLTPPVGVEVVNVYSAAQMLKACKACAGEAHILVMAAAVADYRPESQAKEKIKKKGDSMQLNLVKNPDILAEIGSTKKKNQLLIGFALETENETANAKDKLRRKNLDMIVLNSLKDAGAGFGHDTNKVTLIYPDKKAKSFPLKSKKELAQDIVKAIGELKKDKKQ